MRTKSDQLPPREYSPAMLSAELHYQEKGLLGDFASQFRAPAWNNRRVNRTCAMSKCTPWELAHLYLVPPQTIKKAYKLDSWPSHIALMFQLHEQFMVQQITGAVDAVLAPDSLASAPSNECPTCGGPLVVERSTE